jgi:hypothetical protein
MVSLEQLPYEVTAVVLSHLSSLQDLLVAISSCRHLHTAFEECPAVGADVFLSCFDSSLLPLSLAVAAEEVKFFPRPRMADDVQRFVHALTTDERRLLARLRAMPLSRIFSMSRTEDAIINLTFDFAQEAWMRQEACFGQREVGLSPAETTRFARAFYRLEILVNAFRSEEALSPPELKREGKRWLLTTYLPHEREQIAAAHDYLEKKLGKGMFWP